jgi:hypothetical protein
MEQRGTRRTSTPEGEPPPRHEGGLRGPATAPPSSPLISTSSDRLDTEQPPPDRVVADPSPEHDALGLAAVHEEEISTGSAEGVVYPVGPYLLPDPSTGR